MFGHVCEVPCKAKSILLKQSIMIRKQYFCLHHLFLVALAKSPSIMQCFSCPSLEIQQMFFYIKDFRSIKDVLYQLTNSLFLKASVCPTFSNLRCCIATTGLRNVSYELQEREKEQTQHVNCSDWMPGTPKLTIKYFDHNETYVL